MIIDVMDRKAMLRFVQSVKATPEGTLKAIEQMRLFREVEEELGVGITAFADVGQYFWTMLGYSSEAIDAAVRVLVEEPQPKKKRKRRSKAEVAAEKTKKTPPMESFGITPETAKNAATIASQKRIHETGIANVLPAEPETPEQKLSRLTAEAADRRAPVTTDPLATQVIDPAVMTPPPPPPPAMLPDGGTVETVPLPELGDVHAVGGNE